MLNWPNGPLSTDRRRLKTCCCLFPIDASAHIVNLHVKIAGDDGLEITGDANALDQASPKLEARHYPKRLGTHRRGWAPRSGRLDGPRPHHA